MVRDLDNADEFEVIALEYATTFARLYNTRSEI